MAASDESKKERPAEKTAVVGGDWIQVGGIQDSSAVVVGRDARVVIEQYTGTIIKADNFEDQPPAPGEPPYKGLAYFTEADKDIYFGRKTLCEQLVKRLQEVSFLALIGASGSGKSSLLRAGLIPRLRAHNWRIHLVSKPGTNPLMMLANNLTQEELDPASAVAIAGDLKADPATLAAVCEKLAARHGAERLLLAIDQFEELFTLCKDAGERQVVVDNLVAAASARGVTAVLVSMRADFYDRVSEFAVLTDLVSRQQEYVKPMSQSDLVRVIAEPARLGGWQFVEGLVEQIVEDVGREPGRLPLLSHALLETWERRRGVVMTLGGYRDAGGVEGAIAQTAEETLHRLVEKNPAYANVCREIFLALTELGEGTEDTRRVARREELRTAVAGDGELDDVLEALIAARLITVRSGEVEVAHEALIRRWPALKEWLADNRERLRFERQLGRDAALWGESGQDEDMLYRGARLAQAAELAALGQVRLAGETAEFVAASSELAGREERQREARRQHELENAQRLAAAAQAREAAEIEARGAAEAQRAAEENARLQAEAAAAKLRKWAISLAGVLAVAGLLAIAAWIFYRNAQSNAQEAEQNLAIANNNAATATRNLATADAAKATSDYNEEQAGFQAATAVAAQGTAEAESTRAFQQSERALAQSLQANSRALVANRPDNQELAQARLLAIEAARLSSRTGTPDEKTRSESLLLSLAHEQPVPYQPDSRLTDHLASVTSVTWNRDYSRLASSSCAKVSFFSQCIQGSIIIWNTSTWQPVATLTGHKDFVMSTDWNEDGSRLASAARDGSIIIWNTVNWEKVSEFAHGRDPVLSVAWNKNGHYLASASENGSIIIWDTALWEEETSLVHHDTFAIEDVAWSEDGRYLASASRDSTVTIWNAATWQEEANLIGHDGWVYSVAWSKNGNYLASASSDHSVIIWDTKNWQPIQTLVDHTFRVNSVAWNGDGSRLASASADDTIVIYDTQTWLPLTKLVDHRTGGPTGMFRQGVHSVAWNGDGSQLASASADGTVIVWNMEAWQPYTVLGGPGPGDLSWDSVNGLAWNKDGNRLAAASSDGTITVWDTAVWYPVKTLTGHTSSVEDVAWNTNNNLLASAAASYDDSVIIWDMAGLQQTEQLTGHSSAVWSVAWNTDGDRLASASDDASVNIWDAESWQPEITLEEHENSVNSADWSGDGARLATGSSDDTIIIWNSTSWRKEKTLEGLSGIVNSVAWNEEGSRLASAVADTSIIIWKSDGWQREATLTDHSSYVQDVDWNGDGSRLASASSDNSVIIWDTSSWQPLAIFPHHAVGVDSVAWNDDGSRLASGAVDGTIIIWEFPDFAQLNCRLAGRNLSLVEWKQYLTGEDYRCTCAEWPAGEGAPPDAPGCPASGDTAES